MRKKILICAFWLWSALCAVLFAGTTGKIAGRMVEAKTGEGLPGVNVVVQGTGLGAVSDPDGYYSIINIPPGSYSVKASLIGYATTVVAEVRVKIDQTTEVNFSLRQEAVEMGEVVIVAEKPKVERDLTASKQSLNREEVVKSWGTDLNEVISDLPGKNINGGIRGGFGLDVAYAVDGMDMRDIGSNTNFTTVNLSTIQEVEVLTGGWNAEYGQANGAIVNVVTRSSRDRLHGIASARMRPAGKYHWGQNIYDPNGVFRTTMTTPDFWNPQSTWQTRWMEKPVAGYDGRLAVFRSMTPEQRAAWWTNFVNDERQFPQINYADYTQWEEEVTLYGPLTSKLDFMLSGRYEKGVPIYPSALKYNPDMTFQGVVNYALKSQTKLNLSGIFTKFENSGPPRTTYQSSEETIDGFTTQEVPYIRDPYSSWKFWMYGNKGNDDEFTIRPPERAQLLNLQSKLTHAFSANTFADLALQYSQMQYRLDYRDIARSANFAEFGLPTQPLPTTVNGVTIPGYGQEPPTSFWSPRWGFAGDVWRNWVDTQSFSVKADLTSQVTKNHQFKTGFIFSLQQYDKILHLGQLATAPGATTGAFAQVNDLAPTKRQPFEGAFYLQDKMEFGGMIVNAGVRLDFFDANQKVSANAFDPLMLHATTEGNNGQTGIVSYDPNGSGPGYVNTPTRFGVSPRLGISHPITENTVLHFMFGKFNQRPPWNKLLANPIVWTNQLPDSVLDSDWNLPQNTLVTYRFYGQKYGNPELTWEKMTQFEIGFEQNIADRFSLDFTLYYKDAHNLTSRGIQQGPGDVTFSESGGNVDVRLYGDPTDPENRILGKTISSFFTTVNGASAEVRGVEATFGTKFRHLNVNLNYTMSLLSTDSYHLDRIYREFENGARLGQDRYEGANNSDDGSNGLDDDRWNPHSSAIVRLSASTPKKFGFAIWGIRPLSNWSLSTSTRWTQGEVFNYYPTDYTGPRVPNNRRWKDRWSTNLNLSKTISGLGGVSARFFLQTTNVFNQKHLRLFTGTALRDYMEEGRRPVHSVTREPMEWAWYSNFPRRTDFGLSVEF